jgi:hypothetical protein
MCSMCFLCGSILTAGGIWLKTKPNQTRPTADKSFINSKVERAVEHSRRVESRRCGEERGRRPRDRVGAGGGAEEGGSGGALKLPPASDRPPSQI